MRTHGWRVIRLLFTAAVVVVLGIVVDRALRSLSTVSLQVHAGWLLAAYLATTVTFPVLAVSWSQLLAAYDHRLPPATAVRLWALAQSSRYLPTGLAAVASRAVLAARQGVPKTVTVATIVVEGMLLVAWSSVAAGLLLATPGHAAAAPLAAAGAAALVAVPLVLTHGHRLPGPWADRRPHGAPLARGIVLVGINMAVKGGAFLLFARALLPVHAGDLALLFGAVNAAVVAGMIGVTPAGIGVREGVLAALLGHRFGIGDATALAVALRAWDLAVELPWVAGAAAVGRRHRRLSEPAPSPEARA